MPFSVAWEELEGSPSEERTRDGFSATRRLKCAWADRGTLRDELLTFPGHEYPHTNILAMCTGVSSAPFGKHGQGAADGATGFLSAPAEAILTCRYESYRTNIAQRNPNPTVPGAVEMISEDMEPTVEGAALWKPPGWELTYDVARALKVPEGAEPSIPMYKEKYTFTRHHLNVPPNTLGELLLHCNQQPLETRLLGMTFEPETLLFMGVRINVVSDSTGTRKFTANYNFHYQPNGWNRFPRINTATGLLQWYHMYVGDLSAPSSDGVQIKVFPPANFSNI